MILISLSLSSLVLFLSLSLCVYDWVLVRGQGWAQSLSSYFSNAGITRIY